MGSGFRAVFLLFALAIGASVSCGAPGTTATASLSSKDVQVTDDAGRTVKLGGAAKKVVSLAPSNTELVYAVGAGGAVVAVDDYSDYPAETKSLPKVGGFATIDIEKVVSLGPDVVLATDIHVKGLVPELERRGIPVVVVQPKSIEAVLDSIHLVAKLTGRDREGADLAGQLRRRLETVTTKVKSAASQPRVYFELDAKLFTVGPGSFVDDMIARAGGVNVAGDAATQWPQLSVEVLLEKDPEVILLGDHWVGETADKVKARPGWQVVSAVKSNRVLPMDPDLTNRPGPRVFDGLEAIARALHPEQFR